MNSELTEKPEIKCVIYARVARRDDDALRRQVEAATASAAKRGLTVIAVFTDSGSGLTGTAERPGLAAALKAIEEGTATALFVRDLDRIARDYATCKEVGQQLKEHGAMLHVQIFEAPIDPSEPIGQMLFGLADLERDKVRRRTLQAKRRYAKERKASA